LARFDFLFYLERIKFGFGLGTHPEALIIAATYYLTILTSRIGVEDRKVKGEKETSKAGSSLKRKNNIYLCP